MPRKKIENLISQLHDTFGDDETSAQQARLMQDLENHIHNWDEPALPDPTIAETVEMLLEEIEEDHPKAAAVVKQIMEVLQNIGV